MTFPLSLLILVLLSGTRLGLAYVDPGQAGPFEVQSRAETLPRAGGGTVPASVYYPAALGGEIDPAAGACPLVVYQHGFARSPGRYTDIAEHLASRGYVVVLGDFPCGFLGCDHDRNADTVVTIISWMLDESATPGSFYEGRIDRDAIGSSGHSAGGLWALVAASRDARIGASAPMDPVDNNELGVSSMASIDAAVSITYSEPSSCNAQQSARDFYDAGVDPKRGMLLVGANHCDPEKNGDFFGCELTCGPWNAARHALYVRTMTAWFDYHLRCDADYYDDVAGTWVEERLNEGALSYEAELRPPAPVALSAEWTGTVLLERAAPLRCAGVTSWNVYRRTLPGGALTPVASGLPLSQLSWADESAEPGASYAYLARDVFEDFRESFESADSPEATIDVPGSGTTPREASPRGGLPLLATRGAGESIAISYGPAECAEDHTVYWDTVSGPGAPLWRGQACGLGASGSASFDPGPLPVGSALRFVVVGHDGLVEGSYGLDSEGGERQPGEGFSECPFPQSLAGNCP